MRPWQLRPRLKCLDSIITTAALPMAAAVAGLAVSAAARLRKDA
jgi:hypothetical protein